MVINADGLFADTSPDGMYPIVLVQVFGRMLTLVQQNTLLDSKLFLFRLVSVAQSCSYIQGRKSER